MRFARALSALLALSLLTGCDVNAFLPKNSGGTGEDLRPNTNFNPALSEAELKTVSALVPSLQDALAQGGATAGIVNTLKSVSAFAESPASSYRVAAEDPELTWPDEGEIDWKPFDADHEQYEALKDYFSGDIGSTENPHGWFLHGDFTLFGDVKANGRAGFIANSDTLDPQNLQEFEAKVKAEVTVTEVPEEAFAALAQLKDAEIVLNLEKQKTYTRDSISGDFTITPKEGEESKGTLRANLRTKGWSVDIVTVAEDGGDILVRMTMDPSGAGSATVFKVVGFDSDDKPILDEESKIKVSWGPEQKLIYNGKQANIDLYPKR